jgi:hypothetical protein
VYFYCQSVRRLFNSFRYTITFTAHCLVKLWYFTKKDSLAVTYHMRVQPLYNF